MTEWESTPFATMKAAAEFTRAFVGVEPEAVNKSGFAAFIVKAGRERTMVAQVLDVDGKPVGPVKQLVLRKAPPSTGRRKRKYTYKDGAGGPPQFGLERTRPVTALCQPRMIDRLITLEFKVACLTKLLQSRQVAPVHDAGRGQEPPDVGGAQPPRQVGAGGDCTSTTGGGDTND